MATYYVDKAGLGGTPNDANAGTVITAPLLTIGAGLAKMSSLDTLLVRGATYAETITTVPAGASATNRTRIAAYPGETVWLKPSTPAAGGIIWLDGPYAFIEFDGINVDSTLCGSMNTVIFFSTNGNYDVHHIRYKNAEAIGRTDFLGGAGVIVCGGHTKIGATGSDEILNCRVHGGGIPSIPTYQGNSYAVYLSGPNNVVDGCDLYDTCAAAIQIYGGSGDPADNNTIRNCRLHDVTRTGDPSQGWGIIVVGSNNKLYNNVLYRLTPGPAAEGNAAIAISGANNLVAHNSLYANIGGIYVGSGSGGTLVRNNLAYLNTGVVGDYLDRGAGTSQDHNLFGVDPKWASPSTGDFRLTAQSTQAIDQGLFIPATLAPPSGITTDIVGTQRGSAVDLGAYEFGAAAQRSYAAIDKGDGTLVINPVISQAIGGIQLQGPNASVLHATIVGTAQEGVAVEATATGATVANCLLRQNAGGNLRDSAPATVKPTNLTDDAIDPLFMGATDFRLSPGSPAIDAGTTLAAVTSDVVGVIRPQGARSDIGAYESTYVPVDFAYLGGTANQTKVATLAVTAGDIVVVGFYQGDGTTTPTIADSAAHTWRVGQAVVHDAPHSRSAAAWWTIATITGSITITITSSASANNGIAVGRWQGPSVGVLLDAAAGGLIAASVLQNGQATPGVTASGPGDLIVSFIADVVAAAAGGTTFLDDTLTGATSDITTHTSDSGSAWANQGDGWDDNPVPITAAGTILPPYGANAIVSAAVPASNDYDVIGYVTPYDTIADVVLQVGGRASVGNDDGYYAGYDPGAGAWSLNKGGVGSIGTWADTPTVGQTYKVTVRMAGTAISVYVDDVLRIGPITDGAWTTGQPNVAMISPASLTGWQLERITAVNAGGAVLTQYTAGTGFTKRPASSQDPSANVFAIEDQIKAAPGAITPTWTAFRSEAAIGITLAFKPFGGANTIALSATGGPTSGGTATLTRSGISAAGGPTAGGTATWAIDAPLGAVSGGPVTGGTVGSLALNLELAASGGPSAGGFANLVSQNQTPDIGVVTGGPATGGSAALDVGGFAVVAGGPTTAGLAVLTIAGAPGSGLVTQVTAPGGPANIVSLQLGWSVDIPQNGISRLQGAVYSADGSYIPALDAEITLTYDGVRVFGGFIQDPRVRGILSQPVVPIKTEISAVDYNSLAQRQFFGLGIPAGSLKATLQLLVPYLEGVHLDPVQVDGPALPERPATIWQVDQLLDQLTTETGYLWEVDFHRTLRMFLPGSKTAPFDIVDGDRHVISDLTVAPTRTGYANTILVYGTGVHSVASDAGEIAAHGVWQTLVLAPDVTTQADGDALAAAVLAAKLPTLKVIEYWTKTLGLERGMTQSIVQPKRGVNNTFLITELHLEGDGSGRGVRTKVTALEGLVWQPGWREVYKTWSGTGGGTTVSGTGGVPTGGTTGALVYMFLGGSGLEAVSSPTPDWVPASAIEVQVDTASRRSQTLRVTARLRVLDGGSVQARLFDTTMNLPCSGLSAAVTGSGWTTTTFTATIPPSGPNAHYVRLELLPSLPNALVAATAYLE